MNGALDHNVSNGLGSESIPDAIQSSGFKIDGVNNSKIIKNNAPPNGQQGNASHFYFEFIIAILLIGSIILIIWLFALAYIGKDTPITGFIQNYKYELIKNQKALETKAEFEQVKKLTDDLTKQLNAQKTSQTISNFFDNPSNSAPLN